MISNSNIWLAIQTCDISHPNKGCNNELVDRLAEWLKMNG